MTPAETDKPEQFEEVLTSVAESIGTTLGSLAAKANAAKDALTPSAATQRKVVRQAKALQRSAKAMSKKVSASAKKVAASAKKARAAARKTTKKAKKTAKKTVKKAKRRLRK